MILIVGEFQVRFSPRRLDVGKQWYPAARAKSQEEQLLGARGNTL